MNPLNRRYFFTRILLIGLLFSLHTRSAAQVNIETMRPTALEKGLSQSLKLNFKLLSGNSNYTSLSSAYRADYLTETYKSFVILNLKYGHRHSALFINRGFIHARLIQNYSKHIAWESFAQKEYNDFVNLQNRQLFGFGARLPIHRHVNKLTALHAGIGVMFEEEKLVSKRPEKTLRSTNYINGKWAINQLLLSSVVYFQPKLDRLSDFRLTNSNSLVVNLSKSASLIISLQCRYDSRPNTPVKKYDIELSNGIALTF